MDKSEWRQIFDELDKDGDGELDYKELKQYLPGADADSIFDEMSNGSDSVTFEDFYNALQRCKEVPASPARSRGASLERIGEEETIPEYHRYSSATKGEEEYQRNSDTMKEDDPRISYSSLLSPMARNGTKNRKTADSLFLPEEKLSVPNLDTVGLRAQGDDMESPQHLGMPEVDQGTFSSVGNPEEKIAALVDKIQSLEAENDILFMKNNTYVSFIEQIEEKYKKLDDQNVDLKSKIEDQEIEISRAKDQNSILENLLGENERKLKSLKRRKKNLSSGSITSWPEAQFPRESSRPREHKRENSNISQGSPRNISEEISKNKKELKKMKSERRKWMARAMLMAASITKLKEQAGLQVRNQKFNDRWIDAKNIKNEMKPYDFIGEDSNLTSSNVTTLRASEELLEAVPGEYLTKTTSAVSISDLKPTASPVTTASLPEMNSLPEMKTNNRTPTKELKLRQKTKQNVLRWSQARKSKSAMSLSTSNIFSVKSRHPAKPAMPFVKKKSATYTQDNLLQSEPVINYSLTKSKSSSNIVPELSESDASLRGYERPAGSVPKTKRRRSATKKGRWRGAKTTSSFMVSMFEAYLEKKKQEAALKNDRSRSVPRSRSDMTGNAVSLDMQVEREALREMERGELRKTFLYENAAQKLKSSTPPGGKLGTVNDVNATVTPPQRRHKSRVLGTPPLVPSSARRKSRTENIYSTPKKLKQESEGKTETSQQSDMTPGRRKLSEPLEAPTNTERHQRSLSVPNTPGTTEEKLIVFQYRHLARIEDNVADARRNIKKAFEELRSATEKDRQRRLAAGNSEKHGSAPSTVANDQTVRSVRGDDLPGLVESETDSITMRQTSQDPCAICRCKACSIM